MVEDSTGRLDGVFHALASGTRRSILQELSHGERTVGDLAIPHDMTLAAVAKHIEVLERSGLVARRRQGRTTLCSLNPDSLREAARVLDYYRSFWGEQIDSLERFLTENKPQA